MMLTSNLQASSYDDDDNHSIPAHSSSSPSPCIPYTVHSQLRFVGYVSRTHFQAAAEGKQEKRLLEVYFGVSWSSLWPCKKVDPIT